MYFHNIFLVSGILIEEKRSSFKMELKYTQDLRPEAAFFP